MGDSLLAALIMIDMNGPDIEAVDEVKALILEPVNVWKNYQKWVTSRGSATRSSNTTRKVYSQISGLENVIFNYFIN